MRSATAPFARARESSPGRAEDARTGSGGCARVRLPGRSPAPSMLARPVDAERAHGCHDREPPSPSGRLLICFDQPGSVS